MVEEVDVRKTTNKAQLQTNSCLQITGLPQVRHDHRREVLTDPCAAPWPQSAEVVEERLRHAARAWSVDDDDDSVEPGAVDERDDGLERRENR